MWARLRCTKKYKSIKIKFDKGTVLRLSSNKFRVKEKNKASVIGLLKSARSEVGFSVDPAESDARTVIVHSALVASQAYDTVTIVAKDDDILDLLTALRRKQ